MAVLDESTLADPVALTRALVDIASVSEDEAEITDAIVAALSGRPHLTVQRDGNVVFARTDLGRERRVMLAGHTDTVPHHANFPSRTEGDVMWGCGTSDMKSGTAIALHLAATLTNPRHDLSFAFYDCEEIEAEKNGLNRVAATHPEWLEADFAFLLEPTYAAVEAGCQGTMRVDVRTTGVRAHAARSWLGRNAIHDAAEVLNRLARYEARRVTIDGCEYREGLNAMFISGGVAGNVVPDECVVQINFRFAPDRDIAGAEAHLREVFGGLDVTVVDAAPGALPGLDAPAAKDFLAAVGRPAAAKLGWTDVARFAALGVPAVNYGPGDPNLAHKQDERVEIPKIIECAAVLRDYLSLEA
ncbi:succinyl-diaminopimelate desuccinylase [Actinorhabdospora filicis]|uniref:Succinyl-diaminopimelate desuccinylase n=1 Tax=Actinorhabdospora filicis TaxID=1785913 RepID=A0A9W6SH00_9ACTN|nr:succinyl-diaminopimelate desuccinylase [Actinorhabdospora filicis]GLZ75234.1 succinyl-diaminopimelate desuccinylase [Actinorhabdospora filicis]